MSGEKYFIDQDNDGHWYVVEAKERKKWNDWTDLDPDDEMSWTHPKFATAIGSHPCAIEFENPE